MANKIKEIVKKNDLKIKDILDETGLSKSSFYDIANGNSVPSLVNARKISKAIGVSLDEAFPDEDFPDEDYLSE